MQGKKEERRCFQKERGVTLFMVTASLFVLLGMAALAIDLVSLYVTRSEAQRAADAAALAAAKKLAQSGYFSGFITQSEAETKAKEEAKAVGGQNLVGGEAAVILDSDIVFDFSVSNNPRVSVLVQRTDARGNAMPTFFAKAIGFADADVAAVATAEAYTPGGGGPTVCTSCMKPWIMPNCDPENFEVPDPPFCPAGTARYVDEVTGEILNNVVGQMRSLKYGDPHDAAVPSQFYPIQIPPGTEPTACPECAQDPGGSEGPGAALYRHNISCCNTAQFYCGQEVDVQLEAGNMVGPTGQGVRCLISQGPGNSGGQDTISFTNGIEIFAGSLNPLVLGGIIPAGTTLDTSTSIVTIPLYDGHVLCPGASCGATVTIVGFLEVFVKEVRQPQNTVDAYILNVSGCGSTAGGGGGPLCDGTGGGSGSVGSGGSPTPVRLIQNPDNLSFPPPAP
jgi:hypothetical protein